MSDQSQPPTEEKKETFELPDSHPLIERAASIRTPFIQWSLERATLAERLHSAEHRLKELRSALRQSPGNAETERERRDLYARVGQSRKALDKCDAQKVEPSTLDNARMDARVAVLNAKHAGERLVKQVQYIRSGIRRLEKTINIAEARYVRGVVNHDAYTGNPTQLTYDVQHELAWSLPNWHVEELVSMSAQVIEADRLRDEAIAALSDALDEYDISGQAVADRLRDAMAAQEA